MMRPAATCRTTVLHLDHPCASITAKLRAVETILRGLDPGGLDEDERVRLAHLFAAGARAFSGGLETRH
jgi:hypothetical protein